MRTIVVAEDYPASAQTLWQLAVRYDVLQQMMSGPLVSVRCPPGEERAGDSVRLTFRLWDAIPVGNWRFEVTERNDAAWRLRSEESGTFVRRWTHTITIEPLSDTTARHTDKIDIDAGALTPLIAAFARRDYMRRHRLRKALLEK